MLKKAPLALGGMILSLQVFASGTVVIDGRKIKNREELHTAFAVQLNFTKNNKKNLESLYENLESDYSSESIVKIKHVNLLKAKLGTEYVNSVTEIIRSAADVNQRIILVLE